MEKTLTVKKERYIFIDILKILCCFLVIVNHTNSRIFGNVVSLEDGMSLTYLLSMAYFYLSRLAVPIFFMISGALLLNRDRSIKDIVKNKLAKFVLIVVLFSMGYYIYNAIRWGVNIWHPSYILEFFQTIYHEHYTNAYWFLYSYIGLLILLPILRKMVSSFSKKDYHYLFGIYLIFQCICPIMERILNIDPMSEFINRIFFDEIIIYFILGHYLINVHKMEKYSKGKLIGAIGIIAIYIIAACLYTIVHLKNTGAYDLIFANTATIIRILPCICLIYIIKHITSKIHIKEKIEKAIVWTSQCTLGIYLISDLIIDITEGKYEVLALHIPTMIAMIVWEVAIFIAGVLAISIAKRIPGLKKLL